jgi:predicted HD superfamily hydrolase involved in NAD metabolism
MDYINSTGLEPEKTKYLTWIAEKIKNVMRPPLFRHTINTLESSIEIAESCSQKVDIYRLSLASLVHDYGKVFAIGELKKIAREDKLEISEFELGMEPILHSLVGDHLVSRDLGIDDKNILRAVRIHTIGAVDMSLEEKILFVADKVEKERRYAGVERLRELALKDINLCLIEVYKNTIIYVINKNSLLHPDTGGIWNSICGGK